MAAQHSTLCLLGAMDHLWFHHIVLFPAEATLILDSKTLKPSQHTSDSLLEGHSKSLSLLSSSHEEFPTPSSEDDEEKSSGSSPVAPLDDSNAEAEKKEVDRKERPTRSNHMGGRARCHSSSPTTQKRPRSFRNSSSNMSKLQKSKSCRSLLDLELEEVKGFMDLGFIFKKEHLNPRVMSVVPGLQRVRSYKSKQTTEPDTDAAEIAKEDKVLEQEEYYRNIVRPYLSEAWLIKRPDSPLLNLRMPRNITAPADMKKHLRFWAKTVASAIQQEC